jgi:hypothetical protein
MANTITSSLKKCKGKKSIVVATTIHQRSRKGGEINEQRLRRDPTSGKFQQLPN